MLTSPATDSAGRRCGAESRSGFTLVEMSVALLVISLLAILALPFASPAASRTAMRTSAMEIEALLRQQRNAALRTGHVKSILVDVDGGVLRAEDSSASVVLRPAHVLTVVPARLSRLEFEPDGTAHAAAIHLRSGDLAMTISINPLTAAVTLEDR